MRDLIVKGGTALAALVMVAGLFWLYTNAENGYVAVVDGKKISVEEYAVYLVQMKKRFEEVGGADIWETDFGADSAEDVAKQNTLNRIVFINVISRQAQKMGIVLTEADLEAARNASEDFFHQLDKAIIEKNQITQARVKEIMEEIAMEQVIFDEITRSYMPGVTEAEVYVQRNMKDTDTEENGREQKEQMLREQFIAEKKEEMFLREYMRWSEDVRVIRNQKVWDTIFIGDY